MSLIQSPGILSSRCLSLSLSVFLDLAQVCWGCGPCDLHTGFDHVTRRALQHERDVALAVATSSAMISWSGLRRTHKLMVCISGPVNLHRLY